MEYEVALANAWSNLEKLNPESKYSISLLGDKYDVDFGNKGVFSSSCNVPAKSYISIIILHYLAKRIKGLPKLTGEWISFKELDGGQGYYPAFKKRTIGTIVRKYGSKPEAIFELSERFSTKRAQLADASVVLEVLDGVPILITLSAADDEFGPEGNILFDKSIKEIFCTEDIVVLSEIVAYSI